jgi:hypothetical protein
VDAAAEAEDDVLEKDDDIGFLPMPTTTKRRVNVAAIGFDYDQEFDSAVLNEELEREERERKEREALLRKEEVIKEVRALHKREAARHACGAGLFQLLAVAGPSSEDMVDEDGMGAAAGGAAAGDGGGAVLKVEEQVQAERVVVRVDVKTKLAKAAERREAKRRRARVLKVADELLGEE